MGNCLSNANQIVTPIARRLTLIQSQLQTLHSIGNESRDDSTIVTKVNENSDAIEACKENGDLAMISGNEEFNARTDIEESDTTKHESADAKELQGDNSTNKVAKKSKEETND